MQWLRNKKWQVGFLLMLVLLILALAAWLLATMGILPARYFAWTKSSALAQTGTLKSLTIYYTCDTSGTMEPCRCSSGQTGGMSRRLGYLRSQKESPMLLVDAGDVTGGSQAWELFEFDYILKGYAEAGYHAVNVGHKELSLGRDRLRSLRKGSVPFVSANVFDEQGKLIFEPYRIVELAKGGKAGIIGIVDTDYREGILGQNLRVGPPEKALEEQLPKIKGKADLVVLLAFAGEKTIQRIAEKFDEIDVIVGGNSFRPTGDPLKYNKTLVVLITDKGKAIGRLRLDKPASDTSAGADRWSAQNEIVMLKENLPADEWYMQVYEDYKKELVARDFQPEQAGGDDLSSITLTRSAQADHYVGADQCRTCHEKAFQVWSASAHAHALRSLQGQNNHFNPRCLPCHTVGYGSMDGYKNSKLTAQLANVQCESCHGRGDYHIKKARGEQIPVRRAILRNGDCTVCHNIERSPGFEYSIAWAKIAHGK